MVAKAFKWSEADARDELAHVHLSNAPENRAFFAGTIDSAGSFGGIFQSSVLAYGSVIKNPADPARFVDSSFLDAIAKRSPFSEQKIAIAPDSHLDAGGARRRSAAQQGHPLLLRAQLLEPRPQCAAEPGIPADHQAFPAGEPGSTVLLRGHVDNARVNEFRQSGGEQLVQSMALKAMELSRQRAMAVSEALLAKFPEIDKARVESVGRGWEEPTGRHRQRAEPARRSAVVHDRINWGQAPFPRKRGLTPIDTPIEVAQCATRVFPRIVVVSAVT